MTQTTWTLDGITAGRGQCEHCGRSLARLFRVTAPDGSKSVVGRVCCKNLTGYDWSIAQAERMERIRLAEISAAADYGDLWTALRTLQAETAARTGNGGAAGEGVLVLRDRPTHMTEAERVDFARRMLAA